MASHAAIWLRLLNPSLTRMCWTWFSAVRSETNKRLADLLVGQSPRDQPGHLELAGAQRRSSGGRGREPGPQPLDPLGERRHAEPFGLARRASSAARARSRSPGAWRRDQGVGELDARLDGVPAGAVGVADRDRRLQVLRPPRPGAPAPRPPGRAAARPGPCRSRRRRRSRRAGRGTARTAPPGTRYRPCGPGRRRWPGRDPRPPCAWPAMVSRTGPAPPVRRPPRLPPGRLGRGGSWPG